MADMEAQTNKKTDPLEAAVFSIKANRPVTLRFDDVNYKIKSKPRGVIPPRKAKWVEKTKLKGISGVICPGEMLGPSGSSKTTLLMALGGWLGGGLSMNDPCEEPLIVKHKLVSSCKSNIAEKLRSELQETNEHLFRSDESDEDSSFERWSTTWWQQFCVLSRREIKERRHESFSGLRVMQVLAIAFLCGLLWWQSDDSHLKLVYVQIGLLYCIANFWAFLTVLKAISTFPKERKALEKERSSGMYKLSSYFLSRVSNDPPVELALPTVFTLKVYWMAGLEHTIAHFFATLFTVLLSVLVFQGFGLALGAIILDQTAATILGSVLTLGSVLLTSGYFVQNVSPFIARIKYVSIAQFTYKLMLISQFEADDTYPCPNSGGLCKVGEFHAIQEVGLSGKATTIVALVAMLIGYRLVAYIALMRIGVIRRE